MSAAAAAVGQRRCGRERRQGAVMGQQRWAAVWEEQLLLLRWVPERG